jgi:hypothetical protein
MTASSFDNDFVNDENNNIEKTTGNGVQHTQKVNSTQKIKKIKKLGSAHKVILFILKKSSKINKCRRKIKTVFSSKFNTKFTYYGNISNN